MIRFSTSEEKRIWIEQVLLDVQLETASLSDIEQLREILFRDQEARKIYLRSQQLDALMEASGDRLINSKKDLIDFPARPSGFRKIARVIWGASIAAALALLLTLSILYKRSNPAITEGIRGFAQLHTTAETLLSNQDMKHGDWLSAGKLSLKSGLVQLTFMNGANLVMEGSAELALVDHQTVRLESGKIWVQCPIKARGFRVITPNGREIVDLGTEFGVEVKESGEMDVHVYDGEINVHSAGKEPEMVTEGSGLIWEDASTPAKLITADTSKFLTSHQINYSRGKSYQKIMAERKDLLVYYDFSELTTAGRGAFPVTNKASTTRGSYDPVVLGGMAVTGRFQEKNSFMVDYEGDGLELDLGDLPSSDFLTIVMWVKVDNGLENLGALLNSNGWEPGDMHFHVRNNGALLAGVNGGDAFESNPGVIQFGHWQMLAVSWNLKDKSAVLYCDGVPIPSYARSNYSKRTPGLRPSLGLCRIGSWGNSPAASNHKRRDLKGRIDEVMVFDHALSEADIHNLYMIGKP